MEIYYGYNTSFPSLLSALFMHCFESHCDDGNELMSVVFIGYLYKEWFFKYSNKVKCDVATQEMLLTAEYPPSRKALPTLFLLQMPLKCKILSNTACSTSSVIHRKTHSDQKWQNNHKSLCNRCFSHVLCDVKLILNMFTISYASLMVFD